MFIQVNHTSPTPKYKQIINSVLQGIEARTIQDHQQLPSINELSLWYDISRDTVEKAYKQLKERGVILSVPGKGYYATGKGKASRKRVLLLFNKVSNYKMSLYEGFVACYQKREEVDLKVYHEDSVFFEQLVRQNKDNYTDFVIIPSFRGEAEVRVAATISSLLGQKRIWWLSDTLSGVPEVHGAVYQNFRHDIYSALWQADSLLEKYGVFNLVFPASNRYSSEIIMGVQSYCTEKGMDYKIMFNSFFRHDIQKGAVYLVLKEDHLVNLVKRVKKKGLRPGAEVGILAYNDSPLKEVLLDGISVVSTDHSRMGALAAELILHNRQEFVENRFEFIPRHSL